MQKYDIEDIKGFMSALLLKESFDRFRLSEATVSAAVSFVIDGKINREFFQGQEDKDGPDGKEGPASRFIRYGEVRHVLLDIIKGKRTPLYFKLVLLAPQELVDSVIAGQDLGIAPEAINSLTLTAIFKDGGLSVVSGTNLSVFSLDKTVERLWDRRVGEIVEGIGARG